MTDDQIQQALMREPEKVAKELEERLRKREKRKRPEEKEREADP